MSEKVMSEMPLPSDEENASLGDTLSPNPSGDSEEKKTTAPNEDNQQSEGKKRTVVLNKNDQSNQLVVSSSKTPRGPTPVKPRDLVDLTNNTDPMNDEGNDLASIAEETSSSGGNVFRPASLTKPVPQNSRKQETSSNETIGEASQIPQYIEALSPSAAPLLGVNKGASGYVSVRIPDFMSQDRTQMSGIKESNPSPSPFKEVGAPGTLPLNLEQPSYGALTQTAYANNAK